MAIAKFTKVVSFFKTTLSARITDSATSITLDAVPAGAIEYPTWAVIEPQKENAEIVYLPSAPTSTTYASVVRGLDPEADVDTAGVGFAFDHPAGVEVILAPTHRHWNELVSVMDGAIGTGANNLRIGDETAADVTIYAQNDQATKPFVRYDESDSKWVISNDGVSTYDISAGGSGLTRGLGVDIQTSAITLDVRSSGGLRNNQGTGSQQCDVDPTIVARLDTANTWGAVQSFTAARLLLTTDPATGDEGTRKSYVDAGDLAGKFGDGSDGALAITSGTTTLNESTRDYYQYTSVSITDTGALAIGSNHQNKAVYIYIQGDLTVTSSATPAVDARGRGGAGGAGGPAGGVDDGGDSGSTGSAGSIFFLSTTGNAGTGGTTGATNPSTASGGGGGGSLTSDATGGTGGTNSGVGGTLGARSFYSADASTKRHIIGFLGGGGGGGSEPRQSNIAGRGAGGAGGGGGGCVIFVVGGNINITGVFNASGSNGGDGTVGSGSPTRGGGGGGGGGGGFIGIFYAGNVTANTATFTVVGGTGGAGGVGDSGTGGAGGNGGNGASLVRKIIASQL